MNEYDWRDAADAERSSTIFVSLVHKIFVRNADDDYLAARILWNHRLSRQFAWMAGQAVEKYTKAACYSNNIPAKFRHGFVDRGIVVLKQRFDELIPSTLEMPKNFDHPFADHWEYREDTISFARRLETFGHPDGRYGETDLEIRPYDLNKLDALCKILRRLCVDVSQKTTDGTVRHLLEQNPEKQSFEFPWNVLSEELGEHLMRGNYSLQRAPAPGVLFASSQISGLRTVARIDIDTRLAAEKLSNLSRLKEKEILSNVAFEGC